MMALKPPLAPSGRLPNTVEVSGFSWTLTSSYTIYFTETMPFNDLELCKCNFFYLRFFSDKILFVLHDSALLLHPLWSLPWLSQTVLLFLSFWSSCLAVSLSLYLLHTLVLPTSTPTASLLPFPSELHIGIFIEKQMTMYVTPVFLFSLAVVTFIVL